ncbi:ABC-2 type transport system permease protein [Prauserella marina]|uniref:ABC-2 type transport system permease protein n=1 Tax=Prauserella marina TaxID=530584 RepID=A0A1G6R523_9PSEU|nr:ABC transporter permease [Prauserella marina]PWV76887.1 ABC-2 type transport system permease protein [Prauserella marina]SDC99740.1 ABC-2 type transport system permease protein [Prauserella marina]
MTTTMDKAAMAKTGVPLAGFGKLVASEGKLVLRDTAGVVIPIGLPMLIMLMNGMGSDGERIPEFGGLPVLDAIVVPMTIVMVVALVGVVNLPSFLATYRKTGVLKRLSVTPMPPMLVVVAQTVVSFVQSLIGVGLAMLLAVLAFDVSAPRSPLLAVGVFLLLAATMYAVGMLVAAVSPTPNSSVAIGLVGFFAMMASGGGFGGKESLPEWLATIGEYLPYGAGIDGLSAAWMGVAPDALPLLVSGGIAVLAAGAAIMVFRKN